MSCPTDAPTYDQVAELALEILLRAGALPRRPFAPDWPAFARLSCLVHDRFVVPSTTFTPAMRHLLFVLASYLAPRRIVGAGTFVGYTLAWLARHRDQASDLAPDEIVALDVDAEATATARRNLACLGHGRRLQALAEDAIEYLKRRTLPIDCLYVDVDAPGRRKEAYVDVLEAAADILADGATILAHDPCVKIFAPAFDLYHRRIREHPRLSGPWVLPVDGCGLSVAVAVAR